MSLPPFDVPPVERGERPSEGRPFVWWLLGALFLFLISSTLYALTQPSREAVTERQMLQQELDDIQRAYTFQAMQREEAARQAFFMEADRRLGELQLETHGARGSRWRAMLILRQHFQPEMDPDFSGLTVEADDIVDESLRPEIVRARTELNAALRDLYSADSLTAEETKYITSRIVEHSGGRWPYTIALERARELSGDPVRRADPAILAFASILVFGGGVAMWLLYGVLSARGLRPRGVPLKSASRLTADSLALRMLIFLGVFVFLPPVVLIFFPGDMRDNLWVRTGAIALVIVVTLYISSRSLFGEKISLGSIGLKSDNLGRDVLWGVGAWLANWPIIAILFTVGMFLAPYVPSGEHPVSEMLLLPGAFLPIIIQAAVFAPFMEEFFFRGCLYQGLQLRLRSVFWAVFLSSLAFAAIHPQGVAMWLALGWIGAMGALLTRQTGSLIPAIVMHAAHNGSLLAVQYFAGGIP